MAHQVFISYATHDRDTADAIAAALEARGVGTWIAPRDIPPGEDYAGAIIRAIHAAPVFLLLYTRHSNESVHVRKEVERAVARGARLIPFRLDDVPPSDSLEYYISDAQWVEALDGSFEGPVAALASSLTLEPAPPAAPSAGAMPSGRSAPTRRGLLLGIVALLLGLGALGVAALGVIALLPDAAPPRGEAHAVIVGIGQYRDLRQRSPHAVPDAQAVAALLKERYGFDHAHVFLDEEAEKSGIEDTLRAVGASGTTREVLVFWSALVARVPRGGSGRAIGYLIPYDGRTGTVANLEAHCISLVDVRRDLERPGLRVLLIVNAAMGGATVPTVDADRASSFQVLTAAQGRQTPLLEEGDTRSVFTAGLLRELEDAHGQLTARSLASGIATRVIAVARGRRSLQTPWFAQLSGREDYVLQAGD